MTSWENIQKSKKTDFDKCMERGMVERCPRTSGRACLQK